MICKVTENIKLEKKTLFTYDEQVLNHIFYYQIVKTENFNGHISCFLKLLSSGMIIIV